MKSKKKRSPTAKKVTNLRRAAKGFRAIIDSTFRNLGLSPAKKKNKSVRPKKKPEKKLLTCAARIFDEDGKLIKTEIFEASSQEQAERWANQGMKKLGLVSYDLKVFDEETLAKQMAKDKLKKRLALTLYAAPRNDN